MSTESHKCITFIDQLIENFPIDTLQALDDKKDILDLVICRAASEDFSRYYCKVPSLYSQGLRVVDLNLVN